MTNQTLAQYANLSVYSAMAVFTIAMTAFALDLAGAAPAVQGEGAGPQSISTSPSRKQQITRSCPNWRTSIGRDAELSIRSRSLAPKALAQARRRTRRT